MSGTGSVGAKYVGKGSGKRRERRTTGISARQQRIRKRKTSGLTDKIQARRLGRFIGPEMRDRSMNRSDRRFVMRLLEARS